jgi:predicted RNA-binding protein Jag
MENIKSKDSLEFEFEGKSVEEAVKKAVSALKVQKKDLKIKVVSEEQRGLFGMAGAKSARIIVSASKVVKEQKPKKKA